MINRTVHQIWAVRFLIDVQALHSAPYGSTRRSPVMLKPDYSRQRRISSKNFPIAPKHPREITQHGQTCIDNYFWMRYREDPKVLKYLHAEQDYFDEIMQHTQPIQQLFQEMKGRIKEVALHFAF